MSSHAPSRPRSSRPPATALQGRSFLLTVTLLAAVLLLAVVAVISRVSLLRTQVALPPQTVVQGSLQTDTLAAGQHTLRVTVRTQGGLQATQDIPFTLQIPGRPSPSLCTQQYDPVCGVDGKTYPNRCVAENQHFVQVLCDGVCPCGAGGGPGPGGGGGGGGPGGGGSGGGGGDDGGERPPSPPAGQRRTVTVPGRQEGAEVPLTFTETAASLSRQAEVGVRLEGNPAYSSTKHPDGKRTTVLLAHGRVQATYQLSLPKDTYLVELTGKHDAPRVVKVQLLLNGKLWKTLVFGKGDNSYETKAAGLLRGFSKGSLSIKFLNDSFTCTPALLRAGQSGACDRNLHVDALRFTPVK